MVVKSTNFFFIVIGWNPVPPSWHNWVLFGRLKWRNGACVCKHSFPLHNGDQTPHWDLEWTGDRIKSSCCGTNVIVKTHTKWADKVSTAGSSRRFWEGSSWCSYWEQWGMRFFRWSFWERFLQESIFRKWPMRPHLFGRKHTGPLINALYVCTVIPMHSSFSLLQSFLQQKNYKSGFTDFCN